MSEMLKPCPFCGGKPHVVRQGSRRASMIISCEDCGATLESGDVFGLTMPENYAWNRRAALSPPTVGENND